MRTQKRQLLKLFNIFIIIILLLTLCSCGDNVLSMSYKGYLSNGDEQPLSGGQNIVLDEYEKFVYSTTENAELKSETLISFDFNFYSESQEEVTVTLKWEYTTTIFNIKHIRDLGSITFVSSGDVKAPQAISIELEEEDYFVVKNNNIQQLIVEVDAPSGFLCFIDIPEIFTLTDDDEKALEDEFDKEFDE